MKILIQHVWVGLEIYTYNEFLGTADTAGP